MMKYKLNLNTISFTGVVVGILIDTLLSTAAWGANFRLNMDVRVNNDIVGNLDVITPFADLNQGIYGTFNVTKNNWSIAQYSNSSQFREVSCVTFFLSV